MQVIITAPGQDVIADISELFHLDSPSPSRAKVLFAFWNTFSSVTPAQTLRSWAGAHTGPMSSRHGLRYLIDSAAKSKSTVFLLDLLRPDTLSALDYLKVLPRIRNLATQGILALPEPNLSELSAENEVGAISFYSALDDYKIWKISSNLESNSSSNNTNLYILLNNLCVE